MDQTDFTEHGILLFDGVCNLCDGFVQFVIKRDKKAYFRFAPLQSEVGQELLGKYKMPTDKISTVVLIENEKVYTHSDVGLRVALRLGGAWPVFFVLTIFPRFIRNAVYNWIARNRYRWFGKKDACMMPTPDLKKRFLS